MNYKYRALWTPHIKLLIDIMLESDNQDLIIEVSQLLAISLLSLYCIHICPLDCWMLSEYDSI